MNNLRTLKKVGIVALVFVVLSISITVIYSLNRTSDQPQTDSLVNVLSYPNFPEDTPLEESNEQVIPEVIKPVDKNITVVFFGDVMGEQPLYDMIKNDNANPFAFAYGKFQEVDLVVGDLETTLDGAQNGTKVNKPYNFDAPGNFAQIIKDTGVDLVSLANNHSMDYGQSALFHTMDLLNKAGVGYFGAGRNVDEAFTPKIVEVKGVKFAFFGFNSAEYALTMAGPNSGGTGYFNETLVRNAIQNAQSQADFVVVFPHWGTEHVAQYNDFQEKWGRIFIDAGADLVVGSHPHIRQGYEEYKGKLIFYSLGNFVFTGMGERPEAVQGYMLEMNLTGNSVKDWKLATVDISYQGFPKPR